MVLKLALKKCKSFSSSRFSNLKGVQSFQAGKDRCKACHPFPLLWEIQLRRKTQWKVDQLSDVFSEYPVNI